MRTTLMLVLAAVLCGCAKSPVVEFRLGDTKRAEGLTEMTHPGSGRTVFLSDTQILSDADFAAVYAFRPATTRESRRDVVVTFSEEAGKKLADAVAADPGKVVGIFVDGVFVSALRFSDEIGGLSMFIGRGPDGETQGTRGSRRDE